MTLGLAMLAAILGSASPCAVEPPQPDRPWMNPHLDADSRSQLLLASMTQDEKLTLVFGYFSTDAPWKNFKRPKEGLEQSAGYVGGSARLGIPALMETDAGTGVASQPGANARLRTALPSNLATVASWDPELAYAGGRMIGNEARMSGFNVLLAGGINLAREPRNGRNFEYAGEDPLLAAGMVAAQLRGIQSNHIISTIKHYALNDQETNRTTLSVHIDERSARMSDLLAFELAIAQSSPGAVMCAYNRVNGIYSCENRWLLDEVLKGDWGYKGFVMSDWGAVHSTIPAANAGLDQESGYPFDVSPYFSDALKEAVEDGHVPAARLDDMATRILRSMFVNGVFDDPVTAGDIDFEAHARVSQAAAEDAMVLLKNDRHLLPLDKSVKSILIVGSHADVGVLSGGGSSQVYPVGGAAVLEPRVKGGPKVYFRSSPMQALAARTQARIAYDPGTDIKAAANLARHSDVVVVFAHQWTAEGMDGTMHLDEDQDALIAALARANARTIVVLETGGPVLMPWVDKVAAVLEAWYPGSSGGEAIARVLTGEVNPSGRLPLTFPRSLEQLPRPQLDGFPEQRNARISVDYTIEGAAVGYKWFDRKRLEPLFPFGHGLSYTRFELSNLGAEADDKRLNVRFAVKNTGDRAGKYVAQVYVSAVGAAAVGWEAPKRLGGFKKVSLQPGESATVSLSIEPRMLAVYDDAGKSWVIEEGDYDVSMSTDSRNALAHAKVHMSRRILPPQNAQLAPTPPMGWNSWDAYGTTVTEAQIKANADAMAASLTRFGWQYVVVDIQWYAAAAAGHDYRPGETLTLDEYGRLTPAVNRFPSAANGRGFRPLADYIHGKGLKFGIHIMRGIPRQAVERKLPIKGTNYHAAEVADRQNACRWNPDMWGVDMTKPGSQEYYDSLVELYTSWGVDFIKADDMGSHEYQPAEIQALSRAIARSGRPIVLSISPGPAPLPEAGFLGGHAQMWRISDDFWDDWKLLKQQFDLTRAWAPFVGVNNAWPDADMLPVGRLRITAKEGGGAPSKFTYDEQRTMLTLWSIFRSPLIIGGDLPSLDPPALALLANPEVIAVDQSSRAGHESFRNDTFIAWTADVPDSDAHYIAVFNVTDLQRTFEVDWSALAVTVENPVVRDLWERKDIGHSRSRLTVKLRPHASALYRVTP